MELRPNKKNILVNDNLPKGFKIFFVLFLIFFGSLIILSFFLLNHARIDTYWGGFTRFFAFSFLISGVINIALLVFLFFHKNWARITLGIMYLLASLQLFMGAIGAVFYPFPLNDKIIVFSLTIPPLIITAIFCIYLLLNKRVEEEFSQNN